MVDDAMVTLTPVPPVQRIVVVDTTELRWFARGPLPPRVAAWFTNDGRAGVLERRCDVYRLDCPAIGVKLRARRTLELKVRQSVGDSLTVGGGLTGRVEAWRKWSPADSLVERNDDLLSIDVHKVVIKRRFWAGGHEGASAEDPAHQNAGGVDAEVVAIAVEGMEAWSFALAAFGPPTSRRDAILRASEVLFADGEVSELGLLSCRSRGYPDWLLDVEAPPTSQNSTCPEIPPSPTAAGAQQCGSEA